MYDYIGAPWKRGDCGPGNYFPICVGNGGLTFITRSSMLRLCRAIPDYDGGYEVDMWTSHNMQARQLGIIAPEDVAERFSVESTWSGTVTPFGIHKPWHYLKGQALDDLRTRCPEMAAIEHLF
jgi:hypothetical protein